jgi:hypothetical protein
MHTTWEAMRRYQIHTVTMVAFHLSIYNRLFSSDNAYSD